MNYQQADRSSIMTSINVRAPARLHLGFLDLNASIGRKFGSVGITVDSHHTHIAVSPAKSIATLSGIALSAGQQQRIEKLVERFYQTIGKHVDINHRNANIEIKQLIPEHAGLGSGTQLALVLGHALSRYHHISISTPDIAHQLGRGERSGIGIAAFDRGGFLIDGGSQPGQRVPPLLVHKNFPDAWRLVLIMDNQHQGVHGQTEIQAFQELPVFPLNSAQTICHLTLMQLLPSLCEQQLDVFGDAVTKIQALIGDHFAPAQGGRYSSPQVGACLQYAHDQGHTGIAQSSWGPTGCVLVGNEAAAKELVKQLQTYIQLQIDNPAQLSFIIARADNQGAIIESAD